MKKLTTFILFFITTTTVYCKADIGFTGNQKEADQVYNTLSTARNPADSIKILYDVYDLSHSDNRSNIGYEILEIANRNDNREVTIDILNRLASRVEDTEALGKLMEYSINMPQDSATRGVQLMIEMETAKLNAKSDDKNERERKLLEYAKINLTETGDIYEEILNLYRSLVYLGISSQGSLYLEYLTRLQELVKKLPEDDFAIRNLIYSTAAIYYTRKQDYDKALEASYELLKQVDLLKQKYGPDKRKYQTFDYFRYMVFRRMLENYKGMSQADAQRLYDLCVQIAQENEEVREIFGKRGLTQAFYYMAMHNYKDAIPQIRKVLASDSLSLFRQQEMWGMLVEALDSVGDRQGQFEAMKNYIEVLHKDHQEHQHDAYLELKLRNDVNQLAFEERMELEQHREENRRMRKVSITLVYFLVAVIILGCGNYFSMRQKVKELNRNNEGLKNNLEEIFYDGNPRGTHDPRLQRGKLKG